MIISSLLPFLPPTFRYFSSFDMPLSLRVLDSFLFQPFFIFILMYYSGYV